MRDQYKATAPFFLLTFAITWGLQVPGVLAQRGLLPGDPNSYLPFAGLGIFGPLIAATVLAWHEGGKAAVQDLFSGLLRWRVHMGWYAVALLLPGALLTGLLALFSLAGREGPVGYFPALASVVAGLVISLGEEVGWRGYAQPRLQQRYGVFGAAAMIGVIWYVWHIPMFLGLGVPLNLVFVMLLHFMGGSLFLAWIYNGTRGSLVLAVLGHLGAHLNNSHRALPDEVLPAVAHAVVYAALGFIVLRWSLGRTTNGHSPPRKPSLSGSPVAHTGVPNSQETDDMEQPASAGIGGIIGGQGEFLRERAPPISSRCFRRSPQPDGYSP